MAVDAGPLIATLNDGRTDCGCSRRLKERMRCRYYWRMYSFILLLFGFAATFCIWNWSFWWPRSPYTKVQYLGLSMFTSPGTAADGCFNYNRSTQDVCFLGNPQLQIDLERRMQIMLKAINNAHASDNWDRNSTTLKIFMAPEFFWRGPRGAYLLDENFTEVAKTVFATMRKELSHARFADWVFVLGTVVCARLDESVDVTEKRGRMSYYNFAPIMIGGEDTMLLQFKHFVSTIDFPQTGPEWRNVKPAFKRPQYKNCVKLPGHTSCSYATLSNTFLEKLFGFESEKIVQDGVFEVKGLRVGIEICLDHLVGTLANSLGSWRTVDVHLITSAGMYIAAGPICTKQGGPVFLADGFGRTAMSLNIYGRGREASQLPDGHWRFDVGIVYGADSVVALGSWLGNTIAAFTGNHIGIRPAGFGTLPGGEGISTGVPFKQMSALGDSWLETLQGFYETSNYVEAEHFYSLIKSDSKFRTSVDHLQLFGEIKSVKFFLPTIDMYGPMPLIFQR